MNDQSKSMLSMLPSMRFLLVITLTDYVAQVPYYFYNYYIPYHKLPTISGVVLLGATLLWFLAGYSGYVREKTWGKNVLVSFLLIEAVFYFYSILSGAFMFQIHNPSLIIRTVFIIGYLSGSVSAYYSYRILCFNVQE